MVLNIDTENSAKSLSTLAPFVTIIVTVFLFFTNRILERRHERFKKFLDKRIEIIEIAIGLIYQLCEDEPLKKIGFIEELYKVKHKIQIYFSDRESKLFEKMIDESLKENNAQKIYQVQREFLLLFGNNLRKEVGLPPKN